MDKFNTKKEVIDLLERMDKRILQTIYRTGEAFLNLEQTTGIKLQMYDNL